MRGGWELEKGWRTRVPGLDDAELWGLLMAQPGSPGDRGMTAAARRAFEKLLASMPQAMQAQAMPEYLVLAATLVHMKSRRLLPPDPADAAAEPPLEAHSSTELLELHLGKAADAPLCMTCGTKMRPAGSCYVCEGCGSTSGCS